MDTEMDDQELEVVTLTDEDGVEADFALLAVFPVDDLGEFAVLAPVAQLDAEDPDLDLFVFAYGETDDGIDLSPVDDEEVLERVFAEAERVLFGDEFEDDGDEE